MVVAARADIDQVLNPLQGVKQTGPNKWLARCPAHDDRSPSLAIRVVDDRILIHCFSGCSVEQVVQSMGLQMIDLFPKSLSNPYSPKPRIPKFSAYELFPLLVQEALILALGWHDLYSGKSVSNSDALRIHQAYESVMRLHTEVSR